MWARRRYHGYRGYHGWKGRPGLIREFRVIRGEKSSQEKIIRFNQGCQRFARKTARDVFPRSHVNFVRNSRRQGLRRGAGNVIHHDGKGDDVVCHIFAGSRESLVYRLDLQILPLNGEGEVAAISK